MDIVTNYGYTPTTTHRLPTVTLHENDPTPTIRLVSNFTYKGPIVLSPEATEEVVRAIASCKVDTNADYVELLVSGHEPRINGDVEFLLTWKREDQDKEPRGQVNSCGEVRIDAVPESAEGKVREALLTIRRIILRDIGGIVIHTSVRGIESGSSKSNAVFQRELNKALETILGPQLKLRDERKRDVRVVSKLPDARTENPAIIYVTVNDQQNITIKYGDEKRSFGMFGVTIQDASFGDSGVFDIEVTHELFQHIRSLLGFRYGRFSGFLDDRWKRK